MASSSRPGEPSPPPMLRSAMDQRPASGNGAALAQRTPPSPSHHQLRLERCTPRHVSPRKFKQLQQEQRTTVLRSMPLSPLSARRKLERASSSEVEERKSIRHKAHCHLDRTPWDLGWLPRPMTDVSDKTNTSTTTRNCSLAPGLNYAATSFEAWLEDYEHDFLRFESLEKFVHVKLPEALAFCAKLETQLPPPPPGSSQFTASCSHYRLRVAIFAHLTERTIATMARSPAFADPQTQTILFQARQELFRAIFVDYDRTESCVTGLNAPTTSTKRGPLAQPDAGVEAMRDSDSGSSDNSDPDSYDASQASSSRAEPTLASICGPKTPRTLNFFVEKLPFALKLQDESQRRTLDMRRDQGVLRRIVQTMYQSLGSVFHAWQLFVRQRKEERMHRKGAQLTAMVVLQRGLKRSVFVEWSKATLEGKLHALRTEHLEQSKQHQQVLAELRNEIFLLREKNAALHAEVQRNSPSRTNLG